VDKHHSEKQAQIVYFSHGGGPLPILGDVSHKAMIDFITGLPAKLRRPEVILVISAHWEEKVATLLAAENPAMLYDYYGFPEEAYKITYPAAGSPGLATKIAGLLEKSKIQNRLDLRRGFDHGLYIPLKLMYPQAEIPAIQLSLLRGLDPAAHMEMGKALRELLNENILVIGSGFSFHNMEAFLWGGAESPDQANDAFQNWLIEVCTGNLSQTSREQSLIDWGKAPSARYCHPREEHLMPLQVCAGLAGKSAQLIFDDLILGKRSVAFLWQD